jgi:magnesium chelatase family protein
VSLAVLRSRALDGLDAPPVTVEVHLANGLPAFNLVGLPDTEVKEARDRVRSAIVNSGFEFPARRITVNLAPADLPKESGRFDLPIALGILAAGGQIPSTLLDRHEFAGELSLSGELRAIRGALPMCLGAGAAARSFVLPAASAAEAALAATMPVLPARTLLDVAAHLGGQQPLTPFADDAAISDPSYPDLADVRGQPAARRALEIAAAAGHSLLMSGPPGTGKSMLAARLPGLLPPLNDSEALEAAAMQSLAQGGFDLGRWRQRPCRSPHHTSSAPALVGGGALARPGEISLADHGILFLDELPEFDRRVLEVLREPLETGRINVSRAARRAEYPARFLFVAAMNPCPCGYRGHASGKCRCTPDQVTRYRGRISGPLLDRIDLHVEVGSLDAGELEAAASGEASAAVRARVVAARALQEARQGGVNSRLDAAGVDRHCRADDAGLALLRQAVERLHLSARAYHRILKVARTIADLAASEAIRRDHLAEAIQFRRQLEDAA